MTTTHPVPETMNSSTHSRLSAFQKVLLACGPLSSLFYAAMDLIDGLQWPHYSWISQEFSRLSAIGAPSRPIHLVLSPIYTLLVVGFGLGVWGSTGRKRALRVAGGALVVYGLVSLVWPLYFPENLSQPASALTNTMHIVLTGVTILSWMVIFAFAAGAFGKPFSRYTIATLLAVLLFGALTGPQAVALAAGQPTPWLGLTERMNIYSFMLWIIVLAVLLIRKRIENRN
jgi:hypothetical protein